MVPSLSHHQYGSSVLLIRVYTARWRDKHKGHHQYDHRQMKVYHPYIDPISLQILSPWLLALSLKKCPKVHTTWVDAAGGGMYESLSSSQVSLNITWGRWGFRFSTEGVQTLLFVIFSYRKVSKRNDSHFKNYSIFKSCNKSLARERPHQVAQLGSWKQAADRLYIAHSVRPWMELITHTFQNILPCLLFSPTRFCLFIARGSNDACDTWASSVLQWPSFDFNI